MTNSADKGAARRAAQTSTRTQQAGEAAKTLAFPRPGTDGRPWWESYFGPDALRLYAHKDAASGEAEVRSILAAMPLRPGARILDVGCGTGRHALALAKRGFSVIGLDTSETMLEAAEKARQEAGVDLTLHRGDMRDLPISEVGKVDAILSIFTSFGFFTDAENERVAMGMSRSLVRGGRILLDLDGRDAVQQMVGGRRWTRLGESYLLDEFSYDGDAKRLVGTRILLDGEGERRYPFDYRIYSEPEIRGLLSKVGLRTLAVYGSLDRAPFNPRAARMVVLAEKP